jgi:hypothetical protein
MLKASQPTLLAVVDDADDSFRVATTRAASRLISLQAAYSRLDRPVMVSAAASN